MHVWHEESLTFEVEPMDAAYILPVVSSYMISK